MWVTTGFLWLTWLSHDMATLPSFLPREILATNGINPYVVFVVGLVTCSI